MEYIPFIIGAIIIAILFLNWLQTKKPKDYSGKNLRKRKKRKHFVPNSKTSGRRNTSV